MSKDLASLTVEQKSVKLNVPEMLRRVHAFVPQLDATQNALPRNIRVPILEANEALYELARRSQERDELRAALEWAYGRNRANPMVIFSEDHADYVLRAHKQFLASQSGEKK